MNIPDFAVSSQEAGFDEFLKVLSVHIGLSKTEHQLKGCYKYYGFGNNKAKCLDKAWWTTNIITPHAAIALLTGKQLTEGETFDLREILLEVEGGYESADWAESRIQSHIEHLQHQLKEAKEKIDRAVYFIQSAPSKGYNNKEAVVMTVEQILTDTN
jgi:hypothetical protein